MNGAEALDDSSEVRSDENCEDCRKCGKASFWVVDVGKAPPIVLVCGGRGMNGESKMSRERDDKPHLGSREGRRTSALPIHLPVARHVGSVRSRRVGGAA